MTGRLPSVPSGAFAFILVTCHAKIRIIYIYTFILKENEVGDGIDLIFP